MERTELTDLYLHLYSGHMIIQNSLFQHYLLTLPCILTEKPWYKKTCSTLCLIVTTPLHGLSRTLVTTSVTILLVLGACARSIMEKLASYIVAGGQLSCWIIREKRFSNNIATNYCLKSPKFYTKMEK